MRYLVKYSVNKYMPSFKQSAGFTLMELIIVIILLGVMAVGITGFIKLTTQTYLNVSERDELISSARFVVERLNRELRNAVPNSIRQTNTATEQCLEFTPIVASTVYTDIPVSPQNSDTLEVIPFIDIDGNDYVCANCSDSIVVYPTNVLGQDIYNSNNNRRYSLDSYSLPVAPSQVATLTLEGAESFAAHSPTRRAYIINSPISYCVILTGGEAKIERFSNYNLLQNQQSSNDLIALGASRSLMAESLAYSQGELPFTVVNATLQRNAVIQIKLIFTREGERVVFDNAVHVNNVP